ncbi:Type I secretion system membrane fusion protein PrsE [Asticcacaulis sp. MM231]|uniref:HlyD family type I secretion periplasmic adaptor subunit n=1 Tax=Asticcacaulis sp. MM231 TaxID=3157666 RepID=UPI0032D58EB0
MKGQVLVRLDATQAGANDTIVLNQLADLILRKSRLEAELSNRPWPDAGVAPPTTPVEQHRLDVETDLYRSRQALKSQKGQVLVAQIRQADQAVEGIAAQQSSLKRQYDLIRSELDAVRKLNAQGYAPITRVNQYERQVEDLTAQQASNASRIAQYKTQASALQVQILQIGSEGQADSARELKEVDAKIAQLAQEQRLTGDIRDRVEIRAPASGRILGLKVHTPGGVIGAGDIIMQMVPDLDNLIVEARVDPRHIDQVRRDAVAHIRFSAFSGPSTPEASATVQTLAPDVMINEKTGEAYYLVRLAMAPDSLPDIIRAKLMAGMPVEVNIETNRRSAITYLLKPLTDQFRRAFKEA